MRKYVYENAIVYITEPTEEQKENIRKSTERFVHRLAREGLIGNEQRRNNHRADRVSSNAGKEIKKLRNKVTQIKQYIEVYEEYIKGE